MTNLTTNVQAASTRTADLLAALGRFAALARGGDGLSGASDDVREPGSFSRQLELIGGLAGELGYAGLQSTCLVFQQHLETRCEQDGGLEASSPL